MGFFVCMFCKATRVLTHVFLNVRKFSNENFWFTHAVFSQIDWFASTLYPETLSPSKRLLGGVYFVDEIPRSASGAILREVLLESAAVGQFPNPPRAQ